MNHHKVLLILSLICLIFIQCRSSDVKHNNRKIVKTALVDDDSSNLDNGENLGHRSRRSSKPKPIHKKSAKATTVINSKKNSKTPDILLINVQKDRLERVIGRLGGKASVKYREDPCTSEPCFNNGVCEIDVERGFNSFICKCPPGFSGFTCQKEEAYAQNVMSLHEYRIGRPRLTERHLHFSTQSTVLFMVAVFVSFLLLTHACRTWSKKSDLKYAYRDAIRDGRDVPEPPDTLTISNQLCQDIFCCCCRPKDKKLSVIKKHYMGHRYPISQKELDDIAAGRKQLGRKDSLGIIRSRLNDLSPEARDLLSDKLIRRTSSMRAVSSKNPVFQGYVDTLAHVMPGSKQKISREKDSSIERTLSAFPPYQLNNRKLSFKTPSEPRVDLEYSSPSQQALADNEASSSEDETETEQQLSPEHTALLQNDDLEDYLVDLVVKLSELEASVTTEKQYELPEDAENEELLLDQQLYEQHYGGDVANTDAEEVEHNEDVRFNLDDIEDDEIEKYEPPHNTRIQMTPLKSMPRPGLSLDSSSTEKGRTGSNERVNEIISKISNDQTSLQGHLNETGGRFVTNPSFKEYDLEEEKGFQDLKSINNSNMRIGMSTRVSNSSYIHSHQPPQHLQSGSEPTFRQGKTSEEGDATRPLSDPCTVTSYIHHIQRGLSKIHPYYSRTDIPLTESRGRISPVSDTLKYNREKITPLAKQPEGTHGIEQSNPDILDWVQSRVTLTPDSNQTTFGDISSPQQIQKHLGSGSILRHVKISEGVEATRPSSDPTTVTSYIRHIDEGLSRTRPYCSRTDIQLPENRDRTNHKSETSVHSRERVTPLANKLESIHDNGQWSQDNLDWAQSRVTLTPGPSRTTFNNMPSPQQFQQHFKELVQPEEATIKLMLDTEPYVYPEDLEDIVDEQPVEGVRFFKKTFPVITGFLATEIRSRRQPGEDDEENSSTDLDINNSRNIESNSQYLVTTITDDFMKDIDDRIPVYGKIIASPSSSDQEYIPPSHVVDDSDYKIIEGIESIVDSVCTLKVDKLSEENESSKREVELPPLLDDSFDISTKVRTSDQLGTTLDASHASAPIDGVLEDRESPAVVQTSDQIETNLNASQTSAQIDDILEDIESISEVINDIIVLPNDSSVSRKPCDVNNSFLTEDYDADASSMY